jgi:thiol-disulfide isomerase/thioredoxin/tetratricopeptide (TPR) repeat protein
MSIVRIALVLALVSACKKEPEKQSESGKGMGTGTGTGACEGKQEKTGAIAWFEDDLAKAKACAKARGVPVVIDEWAPWCHTCISMQSYVFTDPSFELLADRFVFVATDTDKEENAEVVAKYPPAAWPTFFVISPDGEVMGRYVGGASVEQFRDFLTESEKTFLAGAKLPEGPLAELVAAERATIAAAQLPRTDPKRAELYAEAELRYKKALELAPADWPRRPDVLVSTASVLAKQADPVACVDFAIANLGATGRSSSATDFVGVTRGCASKLEASDPARFDAYTRAASERLIGLVADEDAPLSADDRSDAMSYVRFLYEDLGQPEAAVATAQAQRALLDQAAAAAPDPFAAMTYNWPRAEVYAYLKIPLELVPALEQSAKDLPLEYDPPYRLAFLYREAGKLAEAIPWAKKAAELAYGPRKARAQQQLADLLRATGDTAAELEARRALVKIYEGLPPGHARPDDLAQAQVDLAALEATAAQ